MRRILLVLAVGAIMVLSSVSYAYAFANLDNQGDGNDPTNDFAVGGFQAATAEQKIGFSAHTDGPNSEDAWGHMSVTEVATGRTGRFRVVCLAVSGSRASLGLEPQNSAASEAGPQVFIVRDSGLPGGTGDSYSFLIEPGNPQTCQRGLLSEPLFPIESGNILVHDAQP